MENREIENGSMRKRLFRCRNHGMECPDVARRDAEKALLCCGKGSSVLRKRLFQHAVRTLPAGETGFPALSYGLFRGAAATVL